MKKFKQKNKGFIVEARQLKYSEVIPQGDNRIFGEKGDWVILYNDKVYVSKPDQFKKYYEEVEK